MCDKKVRVVGVLCPKTRLDRRYDNFITNQRLNLYGGICKYTQTISLSYLNSLPTHCGDDISWFVSTS